MHTCKFCMFSNIVFAIVTKCTMKSKAWFNDLSCRHKHKATYTDCILLWSLEPIARTKDTNQQQVTASFKVVCAYACFCSEN